ncbi:LLM class flavin-dependent oxidoreductase [Bradyrhizobium sp. U87765 SZCCT0131]|uniref:LLM class flavin-dependent oxidoreductase n=1 Tax=unclassified Bradyrhizobium TaxID=2631580 RepID=UPI001BA455AA|nr:MULTISPECIES: LLM class flavin-dependent oxidoreductase [unclassified Bradyrhizobium]MBR1217740.1 LLM class flavin-dependent oxidoreductase [Bradyrhizobium sp. U87765 SZCCT0131]MBR1261314.1 LLM class flavin-dependent oxidoreductase [Bradyrhizobium sp. U87765 SZCCT0134]MBR1303238.1 LLM class flavin-dependent oxidoreductase [Bradyrhizobium sp. U87765 SZCCT0110]MBR1318844.1 LLM class flavin-dependent oxidoreductase [Bradyrhizobium sp. U87765 SZCCT0109]MBR1347169.1 LLM class flavin-dependent ox
MTKLRELRFNAFNMTAPGHNWAGLWSHPRDRSIDYNTLDYWVEFARIAERGLFDGIFLADVFGVYDVFGASPETAIRHGVQLPNADPTLLVSAMALVTQNLGFGITANLSLEHPYQFARRFSTLDHLTRGRIGWNIVTGYLDSGARGMGFNAGRQHDDRYDVAEDFLTATYKLWEGSWQQDAVRRDRASGIFTDPAKVHAVRHEGPHYRVDGIHLSEPSPQRTPLLYQAGASKRGRAFAAQHAEAIFLNGQTRPMLAETVRAIRMAAQQLGRDPYDIRLFAGLNVIVAPTRGEAHDLHEEYSRHVSQQGQMALLSGWTGIDFSRFAPEQALEYVESNAIQSMVENLTRRSERPVKVGDLASLSPAGARAPFVVGSPQDVADELAGWARDTDIDGFNLVRLVAPESLTAFVDLVVPELQSRGLYKTAYHGGTLREKLFPQGGALLPVTHPAARFRRAVA